MTKRIQIVARIDPDLRKTVARVVKRQKTTLNALVETALRAAVDGLGPDGASKTGAKASQ
jgi:predicted HicB family RNase H-like nuclease